MGNFEPLGGGNGIYGDTADGQHCGVWSYLLAQIPASATFAAVLQKAGGGRDTNAGQQVLPVAGVEHRDLHVNELDYLIAIHTRVRNPISGIVPIVHLPAVPVYGGADPILVIYHGCL